MTIKIEVECDAMSCCNSVEINDYTDDDVKHAGYHSDPHNEDTHYCRHCWPKIKKEIEAEL